MPLWIDELLIYTVCLLNLSRVQMSNRLKKVWKPQLLKRELYSEILDHKFSITVTPRTLDLIDAAFGFDFYILKVSVVQGPVQ